MNIFEIGDYEEHPYENRQQSYDRYLVTEDDNGRTVAIKLPRIDIDDYATEKGKSEKYKKYQLCGKCVFLNANNDGRSHTCAIRKLRHPLDPGLYLRNPFEKSCEHFTINDGN